MNTQIKVNSLVNLMSDNQEKPYVFIVESIRGDEASISCHNRKGEWIGYTVPIKVLTLVRS